MTKVICAAIGCKHCSDDHICTLKKIRLSENYVHTVYEGAQCYNKCKEYEQSKLEERVAEPMKMYIKPEPDMTMLEACPRCGSNNLVYTQSGIDAHGKPMRHSIKCRDCGCSLDGTTQEFVFWKWNKFERYVDNFSKPFKKGP